MSADGGYLAHLGPGDLVLIARLAGRPGLDAGEAAALLRAEPALAERILASPDAADLLLRGGEADADRETLVRTTPFLTFAVAVESNAWQDPVEVRRIEHQVAHEVVAEVDVRPRNVVVLGPGTIPKTPSGKLRRANSVSLVT